MPNSSNTPFDPARQLTIKVNACRRLRNEVDYYRKEVEENEAKLRMMKNEGKDPYDIKKFKEVLGESHMMIPDSERRLRASLEDLSHFLDRNVSLDESDELHQARNLIENLPVDETFQETKVEGDAETF